MYSWRRLYILPFDSISYITDFNQISIQALSLFKSQPSQLRGESPNLPTSLLPTNSTIAVTITMALQSVANSEPVKGLTLLSLGQ